MTREELRYNMLMTLLPTRTSMDLSPITIPDAILKEADRLVAWVKDSDTNFVLVPKPPAPNMVLTSSIDGTVYWDYKRVN